MKNIYTSIFTLITTITLAQTNSLQVIGSAGNSSTNANTQLTWTIGELIGSTASSDNSVLTQGFNQGSFLITAIDDVDNTLINIHPNPTADFVNIIIKDKNLINYQYILSDVNGKATQQNKIENNITSVSFQELSSAVYFIQVVINNQKTKTFKIIKK